MCGETRLLSAEHQVPVWKEGGRNDRSVVCPVLENGSVAMKKRGEVLRPVWARPRRQDHVMGALDGRDAVDLYETEPINQIRQCEPGCAPVKRVGSKEAVAGLGIGQSGKGHLRRGIATGVPCELWRRPDDPLQERCPRLDTKLSQSLT